MCNLSKGVEEKGIAKGRTEGRAEGMADGMANGVLASIYKKHHGNNGTVRRAGYAGA